MIVSAWNACNEDDGVTFLDADYHQTIILSQRMCLIIWIMGIIYICHSILGEEKYVFIWAGGGAKKLFLPYIQLLPYHAG